MPLDFTVTEQSKSVSSGVSDLDKAYEQIREAILLGIPGTEPKCIGAVFPGPLGTPVVSKRPVGAAKVETRYYCSRTKHWYTNKKECEKSCKAKPPKKKKNQPSDLFAGASFTCTPHVKVKIKYRVERDYTLNVRMIVMDWRVKITKPGARSLVKAWNEGIVRHEREHADDIRDMARRMLPDVMNYAITGEGGTLAEAREDADNQLLGEIAQDNGRIGVIFRNAIDRKAEALHTRERSLPLPELNDLR